VKIFYNCILDFDVEQVYLVEYFVIFKFEGDIMHFVKIVDVTFIQQN
jgi:hypothetical protein